MAERQVGVVTHYFGNVGLAAVMLTEGELVIGDRVHIKGCSSDFTTTVQSLQLNHMAVIRARRGDGVGMKVPRSVDEHDRVMKIIGWMTRRGIVVLSMAGKPWEVPVWSGRWLRAHNDLEQLNKDWVAEQWEE